MTVLAAFVGLLLVVVVLTPFFLGKGGLLAEASTVDSPARLAALKSSLVVRYLEEEKALERGEISKRTWIRRQEFLMNRYIDASRRQDFLKGIQVGVNAP